ncbi:family 2A encapsulin nanocompartment cargo protein cysteine desulfurase [Flectobacillus major]|uniref:family 2A encapsulin nanocompartment cargo protein cysteine desulfurase n=1 Tax=Flectobacillus major TaxID=103 RepID=UPI0004143AC0|nr:family 2A encapsulin nanocompartment cargo protein cysteine desulfurase [Flectobacillus major]
MSININQPQGLPDIKFLEELANQFFTELPVSNPVGINPQELNYDSLASQHSTKEVHSFARTIPESESSALGLPSLGGAGISPTGSINAVNAIDLSHQQRNFPDPNFAGQGNVPQSVAGKGISPSAHHQGNEVNLANPQTSLPDPHFAGAGRVPQSVAGSGISPSIEGNETFSGLPFASGLDFFPVLNTVVADSPSFAPSPQIPISGLSDASYYFLQNDTGKDLTNAFFQEKKQHPKASAFKAAFDANLIKKDFPILQEKVNDRPLIWLDNAATTQKPRLVIDRISYFYEHENSNIHRAAHELAARSTDAYEAAREKVRAFVNANSTNEIVFVRGATEAINLVAKSWGEQNLQAGDEIIVSNLEHHANIVPWQQLAAKKGLKLRVIPVDDDGQVILEEYIKLLNPKTKLVSFTQVSNALGTVTPAKQIIDLAHQAGAKTLLDGAQSVSHLRVDLKALNTDFFVFSGHKVFGPTGIGVLYGKEDLLNETQPWQGGGNMIKDVTFEHTQFHPAPNRFEAGTGNIADAVGLGAAIDYVNHLGIDNINQYEHYLLLYATNLLKEIPGLRLVGTAPDKASVLSFTLKGFTNDEVGQALNKEGIAVRTGHHCAQPILRRFGLESTVRPSLAFYNTCQDIDTLVESLYKLKSGY